MSLQNAEYATAEACSDEVHSEERATPALHGGLMPKAKPLSLHPLSFEQVIDVLIKAQPKPQKKRRISKPRKGKKTR
jgi:hypothetical protein